MDRPKRPVSTGKRPVYEPCMPHSARIVQDFYPARRAARRPPASPGKGDPASPCSALFGLVGASSGFCHLYSGGGGSLLRTRLCRKPLQGGPVVWNWVGFGGIWWDIAGCRTVFAGTSRGWSKEPVQISRNNRNSQDEAYRGKTASPTIKRSAKKSPGIRSNSAPARRSRQFFSFLVTTKPDAPLPFARRIV